MYDLKFMSVCMYVCMYVDRAKRLVSMMQAFSASPATAEIGAGKSQTFEITFNPKQSRSGRPVNNIPPLILFYCMYVCMYGSMNVFMYGGMYV